MFFKSRKRALVTFAVIVLLSHQGNALRADVSPVVSMLTTCTNLTSNFYPMDSVNWFSPEKHPQIVLFAHLLFPLPNEKTGRDATGRDDAWTIPLAAWHPPLLYPEVEGKGSFEDAFYAEAKWVGPDESLVAHHGLTMPARVKKDYQNLGGIEYIPHTFAMAIGTKEVRKEAGQLAVPGRAGLYRIEFSVDGKREGIAFFRILNESSVSKKLSPTVKP